MKDQIMLRPGTAEDKFKKSKCKVVPPRTRNKTFHYNLGCCQSEIGNRKNGTCSQPQYTDHQCRLKKASENKEWLCWVKTNVCLTSYLDSTLIKSKFQQKSRKVNFDTSQMYPEVICSFLSHRWLSWYLIGLDVHGGGAVLWNESSHLLNQIRTRVGSEMWTFMSDSHRALQQWVFFICCLSS